MQHIKAQVEHQSHKFLTYLELNNDTDIASQIERKLGEFLSREQEKLEAIRGGQPEENESPAGGGGGGFRFSSLLDRSTTKKRRNHSISTLASMRILYFHEGTNQWRELGDIANYMASQRLHTPYVSFRTVPREKNATRKSFGMHRWGDSGNTGENQNWNRNGNDSIFSSHRFSNTSDTFSSWNTRTEEPSLQSQSTVFQPHQSRVTSLLFGDRVPNSQQQKTSQHQNSSNRAGESLLLNNPPTSFYQQLTRSNTEPHQRRTRFPGGSLSPATLGSSFPIAELENTDSRRRYSRDHENLSRTSQTSRNSFLGHTERTESTNHQNEEEDPLESLLNRQARRRLRPTFLSRERVIGGKPQNLGPLIEKSQNVSNQLDVPSQPHESSNEFLSSRVKSSKKESTLGDFTGSHLSGILTKGLPKYSSSVLELLKPTPKEKKAPQIERSDEAIEGYKKSQMHDHLHHVVLSQRVKQKPRDRPTWSALRRKHKAQIEAAQNPEETQDGNQSMNPNHMSLSERLMLRRRNQANKGVSFAHSKGDAEDFLSSSNISEIGTDHLHGDHDESFEMMDDSMREILQHLPEPYPDRSLSVQPKFVSPPRMKRMDRITEPLYHTLRRNNDEERERDPYVTPYKSYVDYYYDHQAVRAPSIMHRSMLKNRPTTSRWEGADEADSRVTNSADTYSIGSSSAAAAVEANPISGTDTFKSQNPSRSRPVSPPKEYHGDEYFQNDTSPPRDYDTFSARKNIRKKPWEPRDAFEECSDDEDYVLDKPGHPPSNLMHHGGDSGRGRAATRTDHPQQSNSNNTFSLRSERPYSSIRGTLEEERTKREMQEYYKNRVRERVSVSSFGFRK